LSVHRPWWLSTAFGDLLIRLERHLLTSRRSFANPMRYVRCPWLIRRMPKTHTFDAQGKIPSVPIATNGPVENEVCAA
jgi:hypothetical protein